MNVVDAKDVVTWQSLKIWDLRNWISAVIKINLGDHLLVEGEIIRF